jgi:hypothetical protein
VINEVLTHTDPPLRTIELFNTGSQLANIGDFTATARNPKSYRIADGTTLAAEALKFSRNQFNWVRSVSR